MPWSRNNSAIESLMIKVLETSNEPLTLLELVAKIREIDASVLAGKKPINSLYSILFRREKKRRDSGHPELFLKDNRYRVTRYSLNKRAFRRNK